MTPASETPILEVDDLVVEFRHESGYFAAVDGLSYTLKRGETLGVVGESGSGKSVTNLAVMGLLQRPPARIPRGKILFHGQDLVNASERELRAIRGNRIAMIFQDPMTSLNPYLKVGRQLTEVVELHQKKKGEEARQIALQMLERVGIPGAAKRIDQYPHQFSGGMRQRVMIAMMLLNRPELLIADEPTTALDVTIQAQILDLLKDLQRELGMAITLITHDLGVVAGMADHVIVMYAGRVMEQGSAIEVFRTPSHPYTLGLLQSIPRPDLHVDRLYSIPGRPPDIDSRPAGCPFAPRCRFKQAVCETTRPSPTAITPTHFSSCHAIDAVRSDTTRSELLERVAADVASSGGAR
jgi:oligopeptide transport system ATP-binding protein